MKHFLIIVLCLAFVPFSFGQRPAASSTPTQSAPPEGGTKNFGWSLKKYEKKKKRKSELEQDIKGPEDDVVRVQTDLVLNDVLVSNDKGNLIIGLDKDDFIVSEDDVSQTIEAFSAGENATLPRSIVLIIDCGVPQGPYLKQSIEGAKILVDKLGPADKMAIVSTDLKLRLDFTGDKTLLKTTLDSLRTSFGLNVEYDTLLAVLNEMFDESTRQRIIVFQGDGVHVIWLKPDKDSPYPVSYSTLERSGLRYTRESDLPRYGFTEVKESIERSRTTIYSIILGVRFIGLQKKEQLELVRKKITDTNKFYGWNKEGELPQIVAYFQYARAEGITAGQTAMFKVAELSGGYADFLEKPEDADNVYSNIFTVIKNRYVIGYYPTNRTRDGRRREVNIQVRNHPEYTVTGRKAYVLQ